MAGVVSDELRTGIEAAGADAGAVAFGAAIRDAAGVVAFELNAERSFHGASTIKVAVLVALYEAKEREGWTEESRVHVRNQFRTLADGRRPGPQRPSPP